jgi:demethylmenaquinone methyltransferase/2-methoxy-6-polyprenyl-1,4-benzoquinol methylase
LNASPTGNGVSELAPSGIAVLDVPSAPSVKSAYVRNLFDSIAPRYDLLNTLLSLGVHRGWRHYAARCATLTSGDSVLDVCAGTGELGDDLRRAVGTSGQVVSVDFSMPMLRAGDSRYHENGSARAQVDALRLPFVDAVFDASLVAFGLRNVADPQQGLCEMARVVRPGGRVVVLEFAQPRPEWFASLFALYSRTMMPLLGGLISGVREAYSYLPASVERWKTRDEISAMMRQAGLTDVRYRDLTFGIACVHTGSR